MTTSNLLEALTDNIVIDKDKCTFCGICVDTCVLDNLRMKLAPCRRACPLGVNCQGYVQLIARGEDEKAREILRETLPFPGILAYICSQPCESNCFRKNVDGEAVAVRALKKYLVETDPRKESPLPEIAPESGKTVAIVGSGPAGLIAAYDLRLKGHAVVVYEAESEPGGMLRWAIPEFRLPGGVLAREIGILEKMGVEFKCSAKIGKDIEKDRIVNDSDATIIAAGCGSHAKLGIEREDLRGVYHGLPLLKSVRRGEAPRLSGRTVVVGGGNVAVDSAQTALRLGAESVTVFSLENECDLPAFPDAVAGALREGVKFDCAWGPVGIVERDGQVTGVEFRKCTSIFDDQGRFNPSFDPNQFKSVGTDSVIIAIGQLPDRTCTSGNDPVAECDPLTLGKSDEKVFIAGDFHSGPSSVVEAMASGRKAAESVDKLLRGEHLRYGRSYAGPVETQFDIDTSNASPDKRTLVPQRVFSGKGDFAPIEKIFDEKNARREAGRCLSCGQPFGKYRTCWFCLPCEVECPHDALWVEIPYLMR